jgi:DNA-binding LytR/AlgR family response regulator
MINVLIVEDSEHDIQLYKNALRPVENARIFYVSSGEEAMELIKKAGIDIFFLDVDLPGMDGFALAKKIRAIPRYALAFIVFITGYSKNQLAVFKELHCYDYIVKPFSMDDLTSKLTALIEQVRSSDNQVNRTRMILLPAGGGEYLINPEEIFFAEAQRNDCYLHTNNEILCLRSISLKKVIHLVDDEYFVRCHRSFAVSIKKIYEIRPINYRLWKVILRDSTGIVDVSGKYFNEIMNKCGMLADQWDE